MLKTLLTCAALAGCVEAGETKTAETAQASFTYVGTIYQAGTKTTFERINATNITVANIVGLTACDPKALYAVEATTFKLWFSNDSGQTWTAAGANAKSKEIACDHAELATLDASKRLWSAPLQMSGTVGAWTQAATSVQVDRIQGGDGSIYGVKQAASGYDVYVATAKAANKALDWGSPIANIGAPLVTGTGAKITGTDDLNVPSNIPWIAWPRRAFALEANGTFSTNFGLLVGNNTWAAFNSGSERYQTLSAAAPNILFGLQLRNGVKELDRLRIEETNCTDGQDNDSDGLRDGEDNDCTIAVADAFCANQPSGTYCASRFQPSSFLGQSNQNTSLVTCWGGAAFEIEPGVCNLVAPGDDTLASYDSLVAPEPANTGHYCNVHWPDGTWGFSYIGTDPCGALLRQANKPKGGKVVRAGLYSLNEANHVFVRCDNGGVGPFGSAGTAPLQAAYNAVGQTTNRCIFQVSAGALPLFDKLFDYYHQLPLTPLPGRTTSPFIHNKSVVQLDQFGNNQSGPSMGIDRFGKDVGGQRETAYDHPLDEGRPLYAVADGVIIENGARDRDVRGSGGRGTPNQGEIYLKVAIGSDPEYRETFVVYYAHVRNRLVVNNQTVKRGQLLGFVGATGATGGFAHLHTGVFRLSNINARTSDPQFGYHVNFVANDDRTGNNMDNNNTIDALGWANGSAYDPWAYAEWSTTPDPPFQSAFTGLGAWSVNLFKQYQAFRYP